MLCATASGQTIQPTALTETALLQKLADDPAAEMVAGIDRFALRQIDKAQAARGDFWREKESRTQNLQFLKRCLGIPPQRSKVDPAELLHQRPPLFENATVTVSAVRWPVSPHPAPQLRNMVSLWGEGILIQPKNPTRIAVILPDADESPEAYLGLTAEQAKNGDSHGELVSQLAGNGFTIVIPQLTSRSVMQHGGASLSQREYLHRAAFELGGTLIGYEMQMIQAVLDGFPEFDQSPSDSTLVIGFGEGGLLALFCGAVDERIDTTICCGYFGPREAGWSAPLSRNIFGLLERFGDAELGAMIAPRKLIVSAVPEYRVQLATNGGAPADWSSPTREDVQLEFSRLQQHCAESQLKVDASFATLLDSDPAPKPLNEQLLEAISSDFLGGIDGAAPTLAIPISAERRERALEEGKARAGRLLATVDAHTQAILSESNYARTRFMNIGLPRDNLADGSNAIDTDSTAAYLASIERFRTIFSQLVIGKFQEPLLAPSPRSRRQYSGAGWTGYDVVLDVFPEVFAYGVLLLPDNIQPDDRRPVVVCQHGLEGRPQDTFAGDHRAYHDFAAKLAERGFIVFAPQNPYIGKDRFRTLQRKLNPLGKSLFSVIVAQHQQILRWLSTLPNVDAERIAFYGLSYGGKSAMRLPALLPQYCLSICSADFNDWVWKNASSRSPYSYIGTGEYEIFEFDLGHTFNYAEMAALIAPRPFMVERGHFDGVAPDDRVGKEFARVRFLYAARLGLPERCEIEWFNGPHMINGKGTFDFLHKHLNWPLHVSQD